MYSVKVKADFSAAHHLGGYRGKCEELHGHNWKVEVTGARDKLDKAGMVMDFKDLKRQLNKVLEKLDHKYLNSILYFKKVNLVRKKGNKKVKFSNGVNPTSENIAKYIYDRLQSLVSYLQSVTVWESEEACATYDGK